ncbi:MAG TPA: hypothetical protein VEI01_12695 [Terriglobales bacterium]|nr:hypothetical protein [Terriglobales bacterium]
MFRKEVETSAIVVLVLLLASCGQSGNQSAPTAPAFFQLVDAMDGGFSYAYAPSITVKDGTYHVFFCSMAVLVPTWDAIRYTSSTDGKTWSTPQIMVLPSSYLGRAFSSDGINWSAPQTVIPSSPFPPYTHDVGMAGDATGSIVTPHTLVGFAAPYKLADVNHWGQWDLYGVYVNPP